MAAAPLNARVAFTAAQWQELERQTMIYKYMMASIPVPPELLLPLSRNPSNVMKGALEMGFSSNSSDPEPWRCRRTDGKKWRCSRDVAPDQKYCERHSHKSRPRSRKPVELPNPNHSSINNNNNDPKSHSLLNFTSDTNKQSPHHFINQTFTSSFDQPRCLEWFMKGESTAAVPFSGNSNPEWQQFKTLDGGKYDGNVSEHQQHFKDRRLNLQAPHQHLNEQLVSPNLGSLGGAGAGLNLNQAHSQETRSFIDAWSDREVDGMGMGSKRRHHSSNQKLPLSSLTLSMSGGTNNGNYNQEDDDENGQVGAFGFMGLSTENVRGLRTPHSQMANPGSWIGSPPGGPLAEALCLGIASSQSTSTSSCSKST
ncbi:Growth-regulating factor 5 [Corchorus olitorius]|uniref:Growth-regulating factor n=1 Tax=Corchorus olitorius TaxID=93759 RepID=A0A1R3K6U1_9ROSI|nr:Growth-regulating factor 5 [Corchorus olitorius]